MTKVFISYRRKDSSGWVREIDTRLSEALGRANVFCDVKSIAPGSDFERDVREWLAQCDVVLVVIGEWWASVRSGSRRRLLQPDDLVRKEVEFALARDLVVVPVLVGNGELPEADELPPRMRRLRRRNAHALSVKHFDADLDDLVEALRRLDRRRAEPAQADVPAAGAAAGTDGNAPAGGTPRLEVEVARQEARDASDAGDADDGDEVAQPEVQAADDQVERPANALVQPFLAALQERRRAPWPDEPSGLLELAVTRSDEAYVFEVRTCTFAASRPAGALRSPVGHSALDTLLKALTRGHGASVQHVLEMGAMLFLLLVPPPLRPYFGQAAHLGLILDAASDALPWELMRPPSPPLPLGLALSVSRRSVADSAPLPWNDEPLTQSALVLLGDPEEDMFPPLPGAEAEARLVATTLREAGFETEHLERPYPLDALQHLTLQPHRAVHLTGHSASGWLPDGPRKGESDGELRPLSGFFVGRRTVITAHEVVAGESVPELVTLASDRIAHWGLPLIEAGCRMVVAAGGGLDDRVAIAFFAELYRALCAREPAQAAVRAAYLKALGDDAEAVANLQAVLTLRWYGRPHYALVRDPHRRSRTLLPSR